MPGQVLGEITQRYLQAAPRLLGLLALSGGAGGAEPKKEGSDERVATPQRQEVRRSAAPSRRLQPARRGAATSGGTLTRTGGPAYRRGTS